MIYRVISWERDEAEKAVIETASRFVKLDSIFGLASEVGGLSTDLLHAVDRLKSVMEKEKVDA